MRIQILILKFTGRKEVLGGLINGGTYPRGLITKKRKSASKQAAAVLIKIRFTCTGVCPIMISCWCIIKLQTVTINRSVFPLFASISPLAICGWENYLISYNVEFQKKFCSRCCCCSNSFQYIRRGGTRLF